VNCDTQLPSAEKGYFGSTAFLFSATVSAPRSKISRNAREASKPRPERCDLLHRTTVAINGSTTAADAAQVCLREVCQQIGWPVGRLFLTDEHSATRFVPNPIWYFSDAHRFEGFRQATEMFEQDWTNKFVLD